MRALLSVYDKTGLEELARGLVEASLELVASGKTADALERAAIPHVTVESVTGSPEMLGGRVKTLHPSISAGILADLDDPSHVADLVAHGIEPISIVVCNLYPFAAAPSVETIDIGGVTLLRAAAKNYEHVAAVADPASYAGVLDELRREGTLSVRTRLGLARAAFAHVAAYDAAISCWFGEKTAGEGDHASLPDSFHLVLERAEELRYGENPHQRGARYRRAAGSFGEAVGEGCWEGAVQHGGRELSYLNLFDAEAAWRLAHELLSIEGAARAAVVVKHANPCGAAIGAEDELAATYERALQSDATSAFGGIFALTGQVDLALATRVVANPLAEVIIAYGFDDDALELFGERRKNMRALSARPPGELSLEVRQIDGGYLVQEPDRVTVRRDRWRTVTKLAPSDAQCLDAELAWRVCARSSSNAVVLAKDGQVVGVGCGQQSRVDAAAIAARKAGGRAAGGAAASDAFFPFRDGLDAVCEAGVAVVVQPGGSLRDEEIVAAADEHRIAMVLTGERHFRH